MSCKLCQNDVPLAKSHIIPELFYSGMYDEKHQFVEIHDVDAGRIHRGQKGYWERLLCRSCESRINSYERHARRLFTDPLPAPDSKKMNRIEIKNLSYKSFKLFLLSVLWRAGISSLPIFKHMSLGPHREKLRVMLNAEDPGSPYTYPCIFLPLLLDGLHLKDFIVEPTPAKTQGHRYYRFVFGGFVFVYFVSSHRIAPEFKNLLVTDEGIIRTYAHELGDFAFLRDVWNRAKESIGNHDT